MRCDRCSRHFPLISRHHRLRRLVIPRCPACHHPAYRWPHKLALLPLFAITIYFVMQNWY